jgi:hypothetical protein
VVVSITREVAGVPASTTTPCLLAHDGRPAGLRCERDALPTPPAAIARAKLATVMLGAVACALATLALALPLGLAIGLGAPGAAAARAGAQALAVTLLTALLTLPLSFVARARRGYLPGVGALLGLVVVTQIAAVGGAGRGSRGRPPACGPAWAGRTRPQASLRPSCSLPCPSARPGWPRRSDGGRRPSCAERHGSNR